MARKKANAGSVPARAEKITERLRGNHAITTRSTQRGYYWLIDARKDGLGCLSVTYPALEIVASVNGAGAGAKIWEKEGN